MCDMTNDAWLMHVWMMTHSLVNVSFRCEWLMWYKLCTRDIMGALLANWDECATNSCVWLIHVWHSQSYMTHLYMWHFHMWHDEWYMIHSHVNESFTCECVMPYVALYSRHEECATNWAVCATNGDVCANNWHVCLVHVWLAKQYMMHSHTNESFTCEWVMWYIALYSRHNKCATTSDACTINWCVWLIHMRHVK